MEAAAKFRAHPATRIQSVFFSIISNLQSPKTEHQLVFRRDQASLLRGKIYRIKHPLVKNVVFSFLFPAS